MSKVPRLNFEVVVPFDAELLVVVTAYPPQVE